MTREEFDEQVQDFQDLYWFCCNNEYYDLVEEYRVSDDIDDYIEEYYMNDISGYTWRDLARTLSDLEYEVDNYSAYYVGDGYVQGISNHGDEYYDVRESLLNMLYEDEIITGENDEEENDNTWNQNNTESGFVYEEEPEEEPDGIAVEEDMSIIDVINDGYKVQILGSPKETDVETEEDSVTMLF